jgi:hypothetical protein
MGLIFIRGIGAQVKETVMRRKGFLPNVSDSAPTNGALRKDNKPCINKKIFISDSAPTNGALRKDNKPCINKKIFISDSKK